MGRFGFLLLVLLVVVIGGGFLFLSHLDTIAKRSIEEYGSAATQTAVTVDRVNLGVFQGQGAISDLKVANPEGFSAQGAFSFANVSVKIDPQSVLGSGPIRVREIVIEKPSISYEGHGIISNLGTLQNNVSAYAHAKGGSQGEGRKLIIENLYLREGRISISHSALGAEPLSADLPEIHLRDIGKGGGTSPAAVTASVLNAVLSSALKIAVGKLVARLGPIGDIEKLGGAVNPLKDLLGIGD